MKHFHPKMTAKSPMYIYATEMVSSYYSHLNLSGKRILSIVGSGDQIIDAYFLGAKEVVGFDINKYAFFMFDLKFAAINELNYQEFLKFFGDNLDGGNLNFGLYKKLKGDLPLRTKNFFDKIYKEFDNNGKRLTKSEYFRQRSMIKCSASDINYYLKNEREYLKCRMALQDKKIQFLKLDVNDILTDQKLKDKFDIINLSNVLNYFTGNTKESDLIKVLAGVTKKISKKVKKDGIFFYYSYSPSMYSSTGRKIPPASRPDIINDIKKINNFKAWTKTFRGINRGAFDRINIFGV